MVVGTNGTQDTQSLFTVNYNSELFHQKKNQFCNKKIIISRDNFDVSNIEQLCLKLCSYFWELGVEYTFVAPNRLGKL